MRNLTPIITLVLALAVSLLSVQAAQAFLEPPAKYDFKYPGGTSVYYYPKSQMWDRCNALAGRDLPRHPAECGVVRIWKKTGKKRCFVFINEAFKGTETAELLFHHGRAHCNGWKHPVRKDHAQ